MNPVLTKQRTEPTTLEDRFIDLLEKYKLKILLVLLGRNPGISEGILSAGLLGFGI